MKRLTPINQSHGRVVRYSFRRDDGLALFHQAFPKIAASGYSSVDVTGALLPSTVGQTLVGQKTLKTLSHTIDFSRLYESFYGERYRQLSRGVREVAEKYARDTAVVLCSKCIDWHEDAYCDADDMRLLLVLLATPKKWTLHLASQQMTKAWHQRKTGTSRERGVTSQYNISMERGLIIGFNQAYLHRVVSTKTVTSKQRPLVMVNFPSVTLD